MSSTKCSSNGDKDDAMAKIYLINVGANTGHSGKARSPVFPDGTWIYVPFPQNGGRGQPFPRRACPVLPVPPGTKSPLDPDWKALTYGDCCKKPRARALSSVQRGAILLFWALLWKTRRGVCIFESHDKGWFLIGALRVQYILRNGDKVGTLPQAERERARRNAHVRGGQVEGRHDVVFLGNRQHSYRFRNAVDWQVGRDGGLMQTVVK